MKNFIQIESAEFDYRQLICDDAGPGYAKNMLWETVTLTDRLHLAESSVYIIDNRITETECVICSKLVGSNPQISFLFKVVDPIWENCIDHYFYQFILDHKNNLNCFLLSVYEAKEYTLYLMKEFSNRFIHIPYPYNSEKEINNKIRINQIILSGSVNILYPYRLAVWKAAINYPTRLFFRLLRHPGYPDISNNVFLHDKIHNKYISLLSKYRYMLLCGSRCELELLKYSECGYAGCLPVGVPPSNYPPEIKKLIREIRPNHIFSDFISIVFSLKKEKIKLYRGFLASTRNPTVLNEKLHSFLEKHMNE